jgi:hypothetical protein
MYNWIMRTIKGMIVKTTYIEMCNYATLKDNGKIYIDLPFVARKNPIL